MIAHTQYTRTCSNMRQSIVGPLSQSARQLLQCLSAVFSSLRIAIAISLARALPRLYI